MNSQVRAQRVEGGFLQRAELVLAVPVGEVGEHEEREPVRGLFVERAQDARRLEASRVAVQQFLGLLPALAAEEGVRDEAATHAVTGSSAFALCLIEKAATAPVRRSQRRRRRRRSSR